MDNQGMDHGEHIPVNIKVIFGPTCNSEKKTIAVNTSYTKV